MHVLTCLQPPDWPLMSGALACAAARPTAKQRQSVATAILMLLKSSPVVSPMSVSVHAFLLKNYFLHGNADESGLALCGWPVF